MTLVIEVRNSRILGVLDEILHSSVGTLRTVELVGLGIAAEVRCTLSVLADKFGEHGASGAISEVNPLAYVDSLEALGSIEDDLVELWSLQDSGDLEGAEFEEGLRVIVSRLESWPQQALSDSNGISN